MSGLTTDSPDGVDIPYFSNNFSTRSMQNCKWVYLPPCFLQITYELNTVISNSRKNLQVSQYLASQC
jgi:hypothetical protein